MTRLAPGIPVRVDDNSLALAYPEGDGTYRTEQRDPVTGGMRVETGWRREQLTPVEVIRHLSADDERCPEDPFSGAHLGGWYWLDHYGEWAGPAPHGEGEAASYARAAITGQGTVRS